MIIVNDVLHFCNTRKFHYLDDAIQPFARRTSKEFWDSIDRRFRQGTIEKLDRRTDNAPDLAVYDDTMEHTISYWGA